MTTEPRPLKRMYFDLGQNIGWVRRVGMDRPTWGTERLPDTGEDYGPIGRAFRRFLRYQFEAVAKPDFVGYEAPLIYPSQPHVTRLHCGLGFTLETMCADYGIECREWHMGVVRDWFLAPNPVPRSTPAIKAAVKARCRELGWMIDNDHEADALSGMDWHAGALDPNYPSAAERAGLFRNAH